MSGPATHVFDRRGGAVSGPEVITLGCRLNAAESEAMRALAGGEDDLVIVNSCAVTNEAVRQTRQAIRRAKRARPEARVVVTGCAAQVEPETLRGDARGEPGGRQSRRSSTSRHSGESRNLGRRTPAFPPGSRLSPG